MRMRRVFLAGVALVGYALISMDLGGGAKAQDLPKPGANSADVAKCKLGGDDFVDSRVRILHDGDFSFADNGYTANQYKPPPITNTLPSNSPYRSSLITAFTMAPPFLQNYICEQLNYVFIDESTTNPNHGWAFWEVTSPKHGHSSDQGKGLGRWIALSSRDWDQTNQTSTFEQYQNDKLHEILQPNAPPQQYVTYPNYVADAKTDSPTMGLLATIAREVGHVAYYDLCVKPGTPLPKTCADLHNDNWGKDVGKPFRIRYRQDAFEDAKRTDPTLDLKQVKDDWSNSRLDSDNATNSKKLRQVYGDQKPPEWASLLAVASPDDEFVELFELLVAQKAGLASLHVDLTMVQSAGVISRDIFQNLTSSPLIDHYKDVYALMGVSYP